jgi:hypothetical protein
MADYAEFAIGGGFAPARWFIRSTGYKRAHEFPGLRYRSVLVAVSHLRRRGDKSFRPGPPVVVPRAHHAGNLTALIPLLIQNGSFG